VLLLLAESVNLDMGTILTVGGIVFGAGGVLAGLKIRSALAEAKTKDVGEQSKENKAKLERVDEKIFDEIKNLNKTVQRRFNEQDKNLADAEKSMSGKIEGFQSKVFRRLDDVQGQLSEQDKRLSLAESEAGHMREKIEKHGRKITMFGRAPIKREDT
jgi:predicted RNase H-like nuclease (RuvC/YqgF family)